MTRLFTSSCCFLFLLGILSGCQKREFDAFYERPKGLGAPIYQQLQSRGNFKHLTAVIDKAGYNDILGKTGWWTFFAPNDAAFEQFFKDQGIEGINGITDSMAVSIVKYALVYNAYRKDQLSTYQMSGGSEAGFGLAFKRKTAYYDWVQQKGDAAHSKIIATNRNVRSIKSGSVSTNVSAYVDGDNNNKYLPYFIDLFLSRNGLSQADYKTFYPNSNYTGFNVAAASVVNMDIAAENGMIHEVDRVTLPLKSIDQYISTNANYSEFKSLLDSLKFYTSNAYQTHRNFVATGSTDSVYVKGYNGQLAFSINSENYQQPGLASYLANESQRSSWSIMAPTNDAFRAYRKKILAKYGNSFFKTAPSSIVIDFINSHMWAAPLWPNNFNQEPNYQMENTTLSIGNAVDKQILSNGVFYGVNQAHQANVFRTVFGVPYLDPAANLTYLGYSDPGTGIKTYTTQTSTRQTLLVMSDAVLTAAGYRYNESSAGTSTTVWGYRSSPTGSYSHSNVYKDNILRMFRTGILLTPTSELTSLSGSGIVEALSGDYVKYNAGKIQTSGTVDSGTDINIVKSDATSVNGIVFYIDATLTFTEKNVGQHLENLATKYPNNYASFYWFVLNSSIYNKTTKAISGVNIGVDNKYTMLAPDNAAIAQAIKDGLLPGNKTTGALPTAAPSSESDKDLLRKFILYHIINGESIVTDGKKADNYLTLLQNEAGDNILVNVLNQPGNLIITDKKGRFAQINLTPSNQLSNRTIIHSITNYLNYNK
ncbi:MAG: fasciclin domain-containing protein [Candidatus Pedobacter colombiensis]|uniref:Fasciclin domain-containing protein n=1 Tax=Candidatus Pedobacter colombiensis TaxID=3121371 RepID=A0AAJ6B7R7_9SPHI|nr:fasciclin domain-containing protein [Pedobacter sp.]WEK20149.1 MAG: fasciclin domain-containing protein [Pedobacter sp.]